MKPKSNPTVQFATFIRLKTKLCETCGFLYLVSDLVGNSCVFIFMSVFMMYPFTTEIKPKASQTDGTTAD